MLEALTAEAFEPHIGSGWTMTDDADPSGEIELELVKVVRPGHSSAGPRSEPFSLAFRGPSTPILPQAIRTFRHPILGSLDLFVVPIGPAADGRMTYEVVFN